MATVGGTLRPCTTVVSQDGAHILVASGPTVRVYSTVTGDRLLLLAGHAADVTAICRHPKSPSQIYTASLDGTIKLWDYAEATIQQTWVVGREIEGMVLPNKQTAVLSCRWRSGEAGRIQLYSFVQKKLLDQSVKLSTPGPVSVAADGQYVACIDRNTLYVLCISQSSFKLLTMHHTKNLTCAAFDNTCNHVAAGDATGRIIIWSGLPAAAAAAVRGDQLDARSAGMTMSTIHWHAHAVGALCFSHDGLYLLSGGREAVLVIWQLETLKKTFLPRLGGPITRIAACPHDAARYAVCQENNAIRVVALSTMQIECSVYGVRPGPSGAPATLANASATCQPGSGYLVLSCVGTQLQFYDVAKDRHVARLAVVPRNLISATESSGTAGPFQEPAVTHVAFSHDAAAMLTAEARPDAGGGATAGDCTYGVKFWDASAQPGAPVTYAVNSVMDDPHLGAVTGAAFHPSRAEAVTAGVGRHSRAGEFRVWVRQPRRRAAGAGVDAPAWHWRCRSVGTYKDLPMGPVTFSPDGSLLAVAAGADVTLWHPETNALMAVLTAPGHVQDSPVTHVCFLHGSPFLVTACSGRAPHLSVWNLLTLSLWWSVATKVIDLAPDPLRPQFAAALASSDDSPMAVVTMDHSQAVALRTWTTCGGRISRLLYCPPGSALFSRARVIQRASSAVAPIVAVSEDRRLMLLPDDGASRSLLPESDSEKLLHADKSKSGFVAAFGKLETPSTAVPRAREGPAAVDGRTQASALAALFDAPSHLLPSTTVLCSQMLAMLLKEPKRSEA